ncbi:MAG: NUDIX hydrolase [Myxococcales bacterium]
MSRQVVYQGRRIRVEVDERVDSRGAQVRRDVVVHPGATVILPLLDGDRVCLIRNQRVTVGEELLEIPAGTLEPPEPPQECAARELAEETGYRARRWKKLAEFYPSPGVLSEKMHLFLAEELDLGRGGPAGGRGDPPGGGAVRAGAGVGHRRDHPGRQDDPRAAALGAAAGLSRSI